MYKWIYFCLFGFVCFLYPAGLQDPKEYLKNSTLQWNWALQALGKYEWSGVDRVLDLGCGDGKISAFISENYTRSLVVGLDISSPMIRFASSSFQSPNLIFQEGDISSLPFHNQFDLIVSFCSLHYIVDQKTGLERIYESLKPGGKFLSVIPGKESTNFSTLSEKVAASPKWASYFPNFKRQRVYFTSQEQQDLLSQCGFQIIYFNIKRDEVSFPNQAALIDWIRPVVNYISHLSQDLREDFLIDMTNIMLESKLPTEDGSILLHSLIFECLCQRPMD